MSRPHSRVFSPSWAASTSISRNSSRRDVSRRGRSSSRGRHDSISDVLNRRSISCDRASSIFGEGALATSGREAGRPTRVRRWDGNDRTTSSWDSIRKDPELWFPNGDCFVHFYARGASRRGPSLRICRADLESSNCGPLLQLACGQKLQYASSGALLPQDTDDDGGYFSNPDMRGSCELFVPAPSHLNRDAALRYHLTTRNFFAWMFERPLVGARLGDAMVDLYERMSQYRPNQEENEDDFLAYIDSQGYTDFRDCPDHALATLHFAEKFKMAELWTDAFVHSVGMNESLFSSTEFHNVSRTTNALITRANLEMELRLEKASAALATFLEDDLSTAQLATLGLPASAAKHVEHFRSFLHSFYVQRHGYWPPMAMKSDGGRGALPKHQLLIMYSDFRNLYAFVADPKSGPEDQDIRASIGQAARDAVSQFDRLRKLQSLPHPAPRLPDGPWLGASSSPYLHGATFAPKSPGFAASARAWLKPSGRANRQARRAAAAAALAQASNTRDTKIARAHLVREYALFERDCALHDAGADRADPAEARVARWVLIYAALQTLASVTRAPEEVRDTQGVEYPLCCQTAGTPPWKYAKVATLTSDESEAESTKPGARDTLVVAADSSSASSASMHRTAASSSEGTTASPATSVSSRNQTPESTKAATPGAVPAPLDLARVEHQKKRNSMASGIGPNHATRSSPAPLADAAAAANTFEALIASIQRGRSAAPTSQTAMAPPRDVPICSPALEPPPRRRGQLPNSTVDAEAGAPPPVREPSLARTLATAAGTPMRCPQPTKPASPRTAESLLRGLDPLTITSHPRSPQSPTSCTSGNSDSGSTPTLLSAASSSGGSDAGGEAAGGQSAFDPETPTSAGRAAPPSPSIYNEDGGMGGPESPATPGFSSGRKHRRDRSSELAQKWRDEIGWRKGPGWDGDIEAMLLGTE